MPCLLCHKRNDNSPTIKFPGHLPCSGCHVQQFADNQNPICTICHTATGLKNFPGLRSFNAAFNHGKHVRQTNCATCHRPIRAGVALSIPAGANAHSTCFACHGPQTEVGGRNIGSCNTCHQPGRPLGSSTAAKAFNVNFNHNEHTRKNLSCSVCHSIRPGSAHGRQVTAPVAAMHFAPAGAQSCSSCHNNKRAFGGTDFADCKKCHERNSFTFRR
jgi:c(7)-type cytochrome triheme protein